MRNDFCKTVVAAALAVAAGAAHAQFYAGAQGGYATGGPNGGDISNQLVNELGYFSASTSVDSGDGGWRVFAGYQMLAWLAVEGAYEDLGKATWSSVVAPPGTIDVSLRTTAWTLGLAARYEFVPRFFGYARISAAWTETKASVSATGFAESAGDQTVRQTVPAYAAGFEYAFTPKLSGRLEYERMNGVSGNQLGGKYDTNFTSLGIRYTF